MRAVLPSIMALAIGGVAALLWWLERPAPSMQPTVVADVNTDIPETPIAQQVTVAFPTISEEKLFEIASRPLFAASRMPEQYIEPAPEPEPESKPPLEEETYVEEVIEEPPVELKPPTPPSITMSGFMADDQGPSALIKNEAAHSEEWLSIGSVIEGWEVVSITSQDVTVAREGSKFVVKLYE